MPAKVVVIFENEHSRVAAGPFAEEVRGGQSTDSSAYDDEVVFFRESPRRAGMIPERSVAQSVRDLKGPGMAAAQPGGSGRIVAAAVLPFVDRTWRLQP